MHRSQALHVHYQNYSISSEILPLYTITVTYYLSYLMI